MTDVLYVKYKTVGADSILLQEKYDTSTARVNGVLVPRYRGCFFLDKTMRLVDEYRYIQGKYVSLKMCQNDTGKSIRELYKEVLSKGDILYQDFSQIMYCIQIELVLSKSRITSLSDIPFKANIYLPTTDYNEKRILFTKVAPPKEYYMYITDTVKLQMMEKVLGLCPFKVK